MDCKRCGKCCSELCLGTATDVDVFNMEEDDRTSAYIKAGNIGGGITDLFISPVTFDEMSRCPFLRKLPNKNIYKCRIYDIRPEVCRDFIAGEHHLCRLT